VSLAAATSSPLTAAGTPLHTPPAASPASLAGGKPSPRAAPTPAHTRSSPAPLFSLFISMYSFTFTFGNGQTTCLLKECTRFLGWAVHVDLINFYLKRNFKWFCCHLQQFMFSKPAEKSFEIADFHNQAGRKK
jgi:hypothetical protein